MASTITNYSSNINEHFPIPGVDNDTSGFRNNFGYIKNAFTATASEIEALQLFQSGIETNTVFTATNIVTTGTITVSNMTVTNTLTVTSVYAGGVNAGAVVANIFIGNHFVGDGSSLTNVTTFATNPPNNLKGDSSHKKGMVYATSSTIYVCYGDYDGTSNIWSEVENTLINVNGVVTAIAGSSLIGDVTGNVTGVVTATAGSSLIGDVFGYVTGVVTAITGSSLIGNVTGAYITATNIITNNINLISSTILSTATLQVGVNALNVDSVKNISVQNTATITATITGNEGPSAGYDNTLTVSSVVGVTTATLFTVGTDPAIHSILNINTTTSKITATAPFIYSGIGSLLGTPITFYRERATAVLYSILPPASSVGIFGDRKGTIFATTGTVYVCFSDYVNTTTSIWGKISLDSTSW